MIMTTTALKKLNLPLPLEMHEALFTESQELGIPATRVVRSLLEEWLRDRRRTRRREEVRRFAMESAGTELDLDPELEAATTEEIRPAAGKSRLDRRQAVEEMRALRQGITTGGMSMREMIEDGRRF
jgi:hypothetical protein